MEFIKHPSCNTQLGPPPGVSDEQCGTLPIKRWREPGFGPVETSFWKPDAAELAALVAGARRGQPARQPGPAPDDVDPGLHEGVTR